MIHWWNVFKTMWTKRTQKKQMPRSSCQQSLQGIDLTPNPLRPAYLIRGATYEDLFSFVPLQRAAYEGYVAWGTQDFLKDWTTNPGVWYLVILDQATHQLIGLCTGRIDHEKAHLSQLLIRPDYQQKGLGKELFKIWLAGLEQMGAQQIRLEVRKSDQKVQQFYKQFDFEVIATRKNYYPSLNDDAYIMQWQKG